MLSAAGLVLVVMGVLAADDNVALMAVLLAVGAILIFLFFMHIRSSERAGGEPLLPTAVFRNRIANLGLVTQNVQWLLLMGTAFVVSAYLQVVRGYNAIQTGVIFTAATGGILASSLAAQRLAKRHSQRTLIMAGFVTTIAGIGLLLALVAGSPSPWAFAPGLLLIGLGVGVMLTPSVNVVQSVFPEDLQGEISGLVAVHLQPRLIARHRGRRNHPRHRARQGRLRRRDDRARRHRTRWARRNTARSIQSPGQHQSMRPTPEASRTVCTLASRSASRRGHTLAADATSIRC